MNIGDRSVSAKKSNCSESSHLKASYICFNNDLTDTTSKIPIELTDIYIN